MHFRPPSPDTPYDVFAPHDLGVRGLTSVAAIDEALDRLDAARRTVDDHPWVIHLQTSDAMQRPYEEMMDTPTMMVGVGEERVFVTWDHEEGGNACSRSERPEDAADDTEIVFRVEDDYGWTSPASLVPLAAARAAVTHWLTTGERPTTFAWEEL